MIEKEAALVINTETGEVTHRIGSDVPNNSAEGTFIMTMAILAKDDPEFVQYVWGKYKEITSSGESVKH